MEEEGYQDEDEDEEGSEKAKREEEYLEDEEEEGEEEGEEDEVEEEYDDEEGAKNIPLPNIAQAMPYRLDGMPDIPKMQQMFVHRIS